jgi:hypothetical protein
MDKNA